MGSAWRGALVHAVLRGACIRSRTACGACLLRFHCIYAYLFETPPPPDSEKMRRYPNAPHPFVLNPAPARRDSGRAGQVCDVDLTLIGRGNDYLAHLVRAMGEAEPRQ